MVSLTVRQRGPTTTVLDECTEKAVEKMGVTRRRGPTTTIILDECTDKAVEKMGVARRRGPTTTVPDECTKKVVEKMGVSRRQGPTTTVLDEYTERAVEKMGVSRLPMTFFEDGICRAYEAEPTKAMNIECLMVLDRPITRKAFRAVVLARGLLFERMRSRVVVDRRGRHLFEELDPETVVDSIIHEMSLPGGTWDDLQALLSRELLKPWRTDLPHWEVFIIRGLRRSTELPGESAVFFRLDHCLGDGFALKNWLMSFTDSINAESLSSRWNSRTLPHLPTTESTDHLPQLLARLASTGPSAATTASPQAASKSVLSRVATCSLAVWTVLKAVFFQVLFLIPALWIAVVESELADTETKLTFDEGKGHCKSLRKEIRVSSEYSLASIRALAKSLSTPSKRVTVNDVLMGIVAGGLRGYLKRVEDPIVGKIAGVGSDRCRLRAIMVTSLREKIRSDKVEFANCLTFLPISLPVDNPELDGRIYQVKSYIDFLKMSPAPWLILRLQQLLVLILGPAALQWKINRAQRKQTLCVSNLPGPRSPVSTCGSTITRMCFWVNPSNMPLMISVLSYAGTVSIMALLDPQVITDVDVFSDAIEHELSSNLEKAPLTSRHNSSASLSSLEGYEDTLEQTMR
eukprot:CAMPEP_0185775250 /NCGR_PEP_ID=MMETSP1174-20130828/81404_1 /TAXON_ID=35687 /ORGANISM="Dictyocha speculum, Strain CCMP1381" /LENGTH=631 /DNA_ID=CAMNT_0028462755 /DNA_START=33 /DNA_END=1928 /DNA_ORIENTATION=+